MPTTELSRDELIKLNMACNGDQTFPLSVAEMDYCFKRLRNDRLSVGDIAKKLGVRINDVMRWEQAGRALEGRPAVAPGSAPVTTYAIPGRDLGSAKVVNSSSNRPESIEDLLRRAKATGTPALGKLVDKVRDNVEAIRMGLEEDSAKAEARAEVARLEKELAEARARLQAAGGAKAVKTADFSAVRKWAQEAGLPVQPTGRISKKIVDRYNEAMAS